jgi:hypothetical protein
MSLGVFVIGEVAARQGAIGLGRCSLWFFAHLPKQEPDGYCQAVAALAYLDGFLACTPHSTPI